jgi:anti-sigma regulatory factor (Ser/Thr protein kinase)
MEPMPTPTHTPVRRAPGTWAPDAVSGLGSDVPLGRATRNLAVRVRNVAGWLWGTNSDGVAMAPGQERQAMLTVPGLPEQVSEARTFARRLLGYQHACVDTVVLLLSELVTNSVRHSRSARAGGRITIAITHSRSVVLVEVTDDGSDKMPSLRSADDRSEQGYGLALVEASAARWGCSRSGAESTTCWFEVRAAMLCQPPIRGGKPSAGRTGAPGERGPAWRNRY